MFQVHAIILLHCSETWYLCQWHKFRCKHGLTEKRKERVPIGGMKLISNDIWLRHKSQCNWALRACLDRNVCVWNECKGPSTPKRVCLKRVSCVTTMYVIKWWRREETCGMWDVSSLLHHFITYIVVTHETRFKHTRFGLDRA